MNDFWSNLFSDWGFVPRTLCGPGWDTVLVWMHVLSDLAIWAAYLWIPTIMLWHTLKRRKTLNISRNLWTIIGLYCAFITLCGWTHFFDAMMFFEPVYRINGLVRMATGIVSLGTAITLIWMAPIVINAPITLLQQKQVMDKQFNWLKDILDAVTAGRLVLCRDESCLPASDKADGYVQSIIVDEPRDLKDARKAVEAMAADRKFGDERAYDLAVATHEAAMNAWKHAKSGTVSAQTINGTIRVFIEDNGPGIPLDKLPLATLKHGYSTGGTAGQGWKMMLQCVDAVYLMSRPGKTIVVLEQYREKPKEVEELDPLDKLWESASKFYEKPLDGIPVS